MKKSNKPTTRRGSLKKIAGTVALGAFAPLLCRRLHAAEITLPAHLKGRVNHSVCKWCYGDIPLEEFCKAAKEIGLTSVMK